MEWIEIQESAKGEKVCGVWSIKKVTTNLCLATNPDSNFMAHAT